MENTELWKDIQGYEGLYQISSMGRVKSLGNGKSGNSKERILKQGICNNYYNVSLNKEGKTKTFRVHRLVATAFIPNPQNYPCVNHKDENPNNNVKSNLEWCSYSYNNNYGTRNERSSKAISKAKKGKKKSQEHIENHSSSIRIPIIQYNLDNKLIGIWESAKQVSEILGINQSNISKCCKGKKKSCGGFKWKYLQDFLIELKKAS